MPLCTKETFYEAASIRKKEHKVNICRRYVYINQPRSKTNLQVEPTSTATYMSNLYQSNQPTSTAIYMSKTFLYRIANQLFEPALQTGSHCHSLICPALMPNPNDDTAVIDNVDHAVAIADKLAWSWRRRRRRRSTGRTTGAATRRSRANTGDWPPRIALGILV